MAENVLTKKLGPQPRWAWAVEGFASLYLVAWYRRRKAAASTGLSTVTATPLTGGDTIPTDVGGSLTTGPTYSSLASWVAAAIGQITGPGYNASQAYNDLTAWMNGSCVSAAGYTAIGNFIDTNGLPPGYSTSLPTLSVCQSASTGTTTTTTTSTPVTPTLPSINAQTYPLKVLFGQYNPGDYTKIGTVTNGVYSGYQVSGGAPVYAGAYGGFAQDFNMSTLPNGTDIYVPTSLLAYVTGYPSSSQQAA